jgi:beta-phosphoglucomutase
MTLQALIFDLDGVIADTTELHYRSWLHLAERVNMPFSRANYDPLRGISRRASLAHFLGGRAIDEPTALAWMQIKNDYYVESLQSLGPADALAGARDFLLSARAAGLRLGIGSSSENAKLVLRRLELFDLFDAIGDGQTIRNNKPAPDLFLWVAGRLDVRPWQAIVFEDAEAGVTAALAGGFWAYGLDNHTRRAQVAHAHWVAADLAQVSLPLVQAAYADVANATHRAATPNGK